MSTLNRYVAYETTTIDGAEYLVCFDRFNDALAWVKPEDYLHHNPKVTVTQDTVIGPRELPFHLEPIVLGATQTKLTTLQELGIIVSSLKGRIRELEAMRADQPSEEDRLVVKRPFQGVLTFGDGSPDAVVTGSYWRGNDRLISLEGSFPYTQSLARYIRPGAVVRLTSDQFNAEIIIVSQMDCRYEFITSGVITGMKFRRGK